MMRMKVSVGVVALALALAAVPAQAGFIGFTGKDANLDGIDDYFTVNGNPAYLVTTIAAGWPVLPDPTRTDGNYISWAANQSNATRGNDTAALFTYGLNFIWSGATSSTTFDFRYLSDDYLVDITLNGGSLGVNNLGAGSPWTTSYSANGVTGTVQNGLNTIEFLVWNSGGYLGPGNSYDPSYSGISGPTGMAADFKIYGDATTVPDAGSSLLLLGIGLAGLRAWRKR